MYKAMMIYIHLFRYIFIDTNRNKYINIFIFITRITCISAYKHILIDTCIINNNIYIHIHIHLQNIKSI